jgi:hypothetical protein
VSLIEQRILISAPIETVWPYVSDPTLISRWNRAYKQIGVLSTKATGVGARRRSVGENGKSVVEEITAWLENLGYEYVAIDGPYQSFRGRYRLQAIPDGTIVNWAVDYQLKGLLAGLRNVLSFRRHQDSIMSDSLRALRKLVESSGVKLLPEAHARYALQAGPTAESRASRVVPLVGHTESAESEASGAMRAITINDDDIPDFGEVSTDQPSVAVPANAPILENSTKPDTGSFIPSFAAEPGETAHSSAVVEDDTKPRPPQNLKDAIAAQVGQGVTDLPKVADPIEDALESYSAPTVPISLVAPPREVEPVPDTQTMEVMPPAPKQPDTLPERIPTGPMQPVQSSTPITEQPIDKRDTKDVSIWDVFGMERPSDKVQAELNAVIASIQQRASESPSAPEAQATQLIPPVAQESRPPRSTGKNRKALPPVRSLRRGKVHEKVEVSVRPARSNK